MLKDIFHDGNGGWVGAVTRLGVPVVLALGLSYFLVTNVSATQALIVTNQASIITNQQAIMASLSEARATMNIFANTQTQDTRVMTALLLQTCLNTADGSDAQAACVRATTVK